MESARIILTFANRREITKRPIDLVTAFHQGDWKETLFMYLVKFVSYYAPCTE